MGEKGTERERGRKGEGEGFERGERGEEEGEREGGRWGGTEGRRDGGRKGGRTEGASEGGKGGGTDGASERARAKDLCADPVGRFLEVVDHRHHVSHTLLEVGKHLYDDVKVVWHASILMKHERVHLLHVE